MQHARSRNLAHWEELPFAMVPMKHRGELRCNSGNIACNGDGTPMIFCTWVPPRGGLRSQWTTVPLDDDLIQWRRVGDMPIMERGKAGIPEDKVHPSWSDPYLFRKDGRTFVTFKKVQGMVCDQLEVIAEFLPGTAKAFGLKLRSSKDGQQAITMRYADAMLNVAGTEVPLKLDDEEKTLKLVGNEPMTQDNWRGVDRKVPRLAQPFPTALVTTQSAREAYGLVLDKVGAIHLKRDAVDVRIVNDVRNGTGKIINSPKEVGGYPELKSAAAPADTDHDGLPDDWEKRYGLKPNDAADGAMDQDGDGYTNLEEHLNRTDPTQFIDYSNPKNNLHTYH